MTRNQLNIIHNCLLAAHAFSPFDHEITINVGTLKRREALVNAFAAAGLQDAIDATSSHEVIVYPEIAEKIGYGGNGFVEQGNDAIDTLELFVAEDGDEVLSIRESLVAFFHKKLIKSLKREEEQCA